MSTTEQIAATLNGVAYPNGRQWRCGKCDFACDDSGPDRCPRDGMPLTRTLLEFRTTRPA